MTKPQRVKGVIEAVARLDTSKIIIRRSGARQAWVRDGGSAIIE